MEECIRAKAQDGASLCYQQSLRCDLGRFAAAFTGPILDVRSDQIDDWLRSQAVGPCRRNGLLTSVKTLFSFARSRSYLPKNERTGPSIGTIDAMTLARSTCGA